MRVRHECSLVQKVALVYLVDDFLYCFLAAFGVIFHNRELLVGEFCGFI
jgi:hypothetical protein